MEPYHREDSYLKKHKDTGQNGLQQVKILPSATRNKLNKNKWMGGGLLKSTSCMQEAGSINEVVESVILERMTNLPV